MKNQRLSERLLPIKSALTRRRAVNLLPFFRSAGAVLTRRRTIQIAPLLRAAWAAAVRGGAFLRASHPMARARVVFIRAIRFFVQAMRNAWSALQYAAGTVRRNAVLALRLCRQEGLTGALRVLSGWGLSSFSHGKRNFRLATPIACLFAIVLTSVFWTSYGLALDSDPADSSLSVSISSAVRQTFPRSSLAPSSSAVSSDIPLDDTDDPDTDADAGVSVNSSSQQSVNSQQSSSAPASSAKAAGSSSSSSSTSSAISHAIVNPTVGNYHGDPFGRPECVWYAWGRAKEVTGVSLEFKSNSGRSARYWLNQVVQGDGVKVVLNKNAVRSHSLAVFRHGGEGNGHVLFIEDVRYHSDGTPRSVVISESNWDTRSPNQKVLSWDDFLNRSDGSLEGYIYLP